MKRLLSKEAILLIFAGFTLLFLTAQISVFQVTVHVRDSSVFVSFSHEEQTTTRLFNESRPFVGGKSCKVQTLCKELFEKFSFYNVRFASLLPNKGIF